MPYGFFIPELVLDYKGVKIYCIYKNDDVRNGIREGWYGYSIHCNDEGLDSFCIYDLPNYRKGEHHLFILKEAIDKGFLSSKGILWGMNRKAL